MMKNRVFVFVLLVSLSFSACNFRQDSGVKEQSSQSDTTGVWLGKGKEAVKPVNAIAIPGNSASVDLSRIRNGIAAAQKGEYKEALKHFDEAIEEDPTNVHFRYYRVEAYMSLKQYDKAQEDMAYIDRFNPDLEHFHALKGRYFNAQQQFLPAYHEFRLATQSDPNDAVAWDSKGAAAMNVMKLREAMEAFNKAIDLNPRMASAYYNRGLLFANNQDFNRAVEDLSYSIELEPGNAQAYVNRGNTYFMMKSYALAEQDYLQAVALDPENWLPYNGLGSTCKANGDNAQAILYYTRAMEKNPKATNPIYNRGLAYFANGERNKACADWEKAKLMGVSQAQKWLDMYCK